MAAGALVARPEGAAVQGKVLANGQPLGEAEITFAHLDQSRSQQMFGDQNFVFGGFLKDMLKTIKPENKN